MEYYDPLGLTSSWVLGGKVAWRKTCQLMIEDSWDTPLSNELVQEWTEWHKTLEGVEKVSFPGRIPISQAGWHMFVDASDEAVAAAGYKRSPDSESN